MMMMKLIKKMYQAILEPDTNKEKKLWLKALKKSIKQKNTYVIR